MQLPLCSWHLPLQLWALAVLLCSVANTDEWCHRKLLLFVSTLICLLQLLSPLLCCNALWCCQCWHHLYFCAPVDCWILQLPIICSSCCYLSLVLMPPPLLLFIIATIAMLIANCQYDHFEPCTVGNCDINTNLAFSNEDHWVCKNSIIFFSKKKIAFATIDFLACVPNLCIFDTHTLTQIAAMTMWEKDLFLSRPKSVLGNG